MDDLPNSQTLFSCSQESRLSETTFQALLDSVKDVTNNGCFTRILECNPTYTFGEVNPDNVIDFECERYILEELGKGDGQQDQPASNMLSVSGSKSNIDTERREVANQVNELASSTVNTQDLASVHSTFLADNNWPGNYNFDISFDKSVEKGTKGSAWTYSEKLDKLFVNFASACPIRIHTAKSPPEGSIIRITPTFVKPEHLSEIVERCVYHRTPTDPTNIDFPYPDHLIRIESNNASYHKDNQTGRLSVSVPFEQPHDGSDLTLYIMRFMCLCSCQGKLRGRPLQIIITLEIGGQCVGRRSLETKVCKCPGRDKKTEENNKCGSNNKMVGDKRNITEVRALMTRTTSKEFYTVDPAPKRSRIEQNSGDEFIIRVKKREHYEMLKKIKQSLELADKVSSEVAQEYLENQRKEESEIKSEVSRLDRNKLLPPSAADESIEQVETPIMSRVISIPIQNDSEWVLPAVKVEPDELSTVSAPRYGEDHIKCETESHVSTLLRWLRNLKMEAYYDIFMNAGYHEVYQLQDVTLDVLNNMMIGEGHRDVLWEAICKLTSPVTVDLSQEKSLHSPFSSQDSTSSANRRRFTITRYKFKHHTSIAKDHDYIE